MVKKIRILSTEEKKIKHLRKQLKKVSKKKDKPILPLASKINSLTTIEVSNENS